ncbi:MAG: ECF transporter S component [Angelakisella sp.]|jgi:hypothetical protein|nr:ECF transporter S component [Angelakisella sp.]
MNQKTKDLVFASLCVALGLVVPQVFHFIPFVGAVPNLGGVFLPMHIPVLLCGFLCGWKYGAVCGAVVPFLSSVVTGMPVLWPQGVSMICELAVYGLVTGLLYRGMNQGIYPSLAAAMVAGRLVSGVAKAVFFGMAGKPFGMAAFLSGAFTMAIPGILLQLVLIPVLVAALEKAGAIPARKKVTA